MLLPDETRGKMAREKHLGVKEVIEELGISRTTFWRARASGIEGFPAPILIGGLLYWTVGDLGALNDAILKFRGRCVFESERRQGPAPVAPPLKRRRA